MGGEPDGVSVRDLNGDGHQDLAIANFYNGISILLGAGDGTFQAATNLATTWSPASVQMADFNGDGKLDIVEGSYGVGTVAVFIGNGDGSFINGHVYSTPSTVGGIAIGDLNGDGIKDIVAA